ncbi:hypothetical protein FOZ60_016153 [Perkinsus olseni]|uniref:Uncharacterized protein n=1 Tax=Perkinsus olseni TaxID=32597 RepID=A0A7J6P5Y3_PEROL|nr:hypothetical protein FOZ60_016153 [Perkinsus olseni]
MPLDPHQAFLLLIKVNEGRSVTVIYRCDVKSDTNLFAGPYLLSPASAPNEYSLVSGTVIEVADAVTLIRGNCPYVDIADDDLGILNFDGNTLRVTVQDQPKSLKRQYGLPTIRLPYCGVGHRVEALRRCARDDDFCMRSE